MPLKHTVDEEELIFGNDLLVKMAELHWKTKERERGLCICQDIVAEPWERKIVLRRKGELKPGVESIGGRRSIKIKIGCPEGQMPVGTFHTHPPPATSEPSAGDLMHTITSCIAEDRCFSCRSGKDDIIRCDFLRTFPTSERLHEIAKMLRKDPNRAHYLYIDELHGHFHPPLKFPVG